MELRGERYMEKNSNCHQDYFPVNSGSSRKFHAARCICVCQQFLQKRSDPFELAGLWFVGTGDIYASIRISVHLFISQQRICFTGRLLDYQSDRLLHYCHVWCNTIRPRIDSWTVLRVGSLHPESIFMVSSS